MHKLRVFLGLISLIIVYALFASCTGGSTKIVPKPDTSAPQGWEKPVDTERTSNFAGFRLETLDERGNPRPDLMKNFNLNIVEKGTTTSVEVNAVNFNDADWCFFFLYYDPGVYKPRMVQFTEFMGAPGEVISIAITNYYKYVAVGMCRVHFLEKPGVSGSGTVCTVDFENKPFGPSKYVSKGSGDPRMGPSGDENRVGLTGQYEDGTAVLAWTEKNIGDGDNSGEVGVPDITPIALDYLARLDNPATIQAKPYLPMVDYDRDLEIGVPDITEIAVRFLTNLDGYQVLESTNGTNYTPVAAGVTVTRDQAAAGMGITGDPRTIDGPLRYTWEDPTPPTVTTYYKVVPIASDGVTTVESNAATVVPMKEYTQLRIEPITDPNALPLVVTEVSRLFPDSAESFARPRVQLQASGIPAGSTDWEDASGSVVWYVLTNDQVASVDSSGLVTARNRGFAVIRTMSTFNYSVRADILITCASISTIELTSGGSTDPISIAAGNPVSFTATGTFDDGVDPDGGTPEDETPTFELDITNYAGWLEVHETLNASVVFPFRSDGTLLTTDPNIQTGDFVRVFCQFPGYVPTDPADPTNTKPKILFGYVGTSNSIEVNFD